METRPIIGVTLGDPAGIGPEIVVKAFADPSIYDLARPVAIGIAPVLERVRSLVPNAPVVRVIERAADGRFQPGTIDLIAAGGDEAASVAFGKIQGAAGQAAYSWIRRSIELANSGEIDAVATAPINKEALVAGGVPYIDHTAMFGDQARRVGELLTLFVTHKLRVFFATRHSSLRQAIDELTVDGLCRTIAGAAESLKRYGEPDPLIAVAALNPHGGEDGLFGDEEGRVLRPAVERSAAAGYRVSGPYPADSVFVQAARGRFDAVISLFHDQGHIAAKMHDFERTVSITVGLPFVRTSVDHGTAFDIAGKGIADATSLVEAIRVAAEYTKKSEG